MPLIEGNDIAYLSNLFADRNVFFYHACQLKDFRTYIQSGGIPSRNLMEQNQNDFTEFETDVADKDNEVWNLVFGNLWDYGSTFANRMWGENSAPVPNPYGPISLKCEPSILNQSTNVSICLRSAGGIEFNRGKEGISVDDIPRMFYCLNCENEYQESWLKYSDDLKAEFQIDTANTLNPEVSCQTPSELLSANSIFQILVDDITIDETPLVQTVRDIVNDSQFNIPVYTRFYHREFGDDRKRILSNIISAIALGLETFEDIYGHNICEENTKNWMDKVRACGNSYQFNRYVNYLVNGTIRK
ncbi:MAG: hypothetical protein KDC49_05580 [Saprospiraceae bacterium]|nr:hypothetical protein [Saprospiraceae bacterium]